MKEARSGLDPVVSGGSGGIPDLALVHDFFAGLGEERLWSDPYLEDPESFANRAARAERLVTTVVEVDVKRGIDRFPKAAA
jgi:hypothetical protein